MCVWKLSCLLYPYDFTTLLALDEPSNDQQIVVQNYEDLVRNYVVSSCAVSDCGHIITSLPGSIACTHPSCMH